VFIVYGLRPLCFQVNPHLNKPTAGMNGHTSQPESHLSPEEQAARAANLSCFELELEFVQALANPHYLESLAVQGILNQPAFVNYLKYLTYWLDKDKGYSQFVL
jgi:mediator of RNA polymerase II transcription subunit 31